MFLTLENFRSISKNKNVLDLVEKCLNDGDNLVAEEKSVGHYVCSCDIGTVQRVAYQASSSVQKSLGLVEGVTIDA